MDKEKEREELERIAEEYHKPYLTGVEKKQLGIVAEYVSGFCEGEILEMGVGGITSLESMMKKFEVVNVVDASEELLRECKEIYGDRVSTFLSLFEEFVPEKKYDTINMSYILEHVYDPVEVLYLAKGWLKRGGVINVVVPHAYSVHRRLGVLLGLSNHATDLNKSDKKVGHRRVYAIEILRSHVHDAGLRITMERGLFLKVVNNARMEDWEDGMIKGLFELGFEVPIEFSGALFFQCRV